MLYNFICGCGSKKYHADLCQCLRGFMADDILKKIFHKDVDIGS